MNINQLIFFDQVLYYLASNCDKYITFKDVSENAINNQNYFESFKQIVFKTKKQREYDNYLKDIFKNNDNSLIVSNALLYLQNGGLLVYKIDNFNKDKSEVQITFKGLEKVYSLSFRREYIKANWTFWIEIIYKYILPFVTVASLSLNLYMFTNPPKKDDSISKEIHELRKVLEKKTSKPL